ncbi:glycoside hydrolase family 65 protein [Acidimicrobiia bacterium EGI L10123]|uniref:glycosyl hydrolase family 65 protein n=1 Tax=Salinilacustrithrix flava TaxID=2957203 RepID=UPI003D7C365D|nr:glycoside hydrolase family 65 protein [Acidimicrobiia bacterium EGI L10123]
MTTVTSMPDRRFEAVVFVASEPVEADLDGSLAAALDAGLAVAVVAPGPGRDAAVLLRSERVASRSVLLLASGDGPDRTVVEDGRVLPTTEAGEPLNWIRRELWARGIDRAGTLVLADAPQREVLVAQVERRRTRHLPEVDPAPGWGLVLEGHDPEGERVRATLTTLADGRLGIGGATVVHDPGAPSWSMVAGVYDGDGPETHLLPGPVAASLPWRLHPEGGVARTLDLRTGVLHERALTDVGPVRSVRFASLRRPGSVVERACGPADPEGPLLVAPDGARVTDGVGWKAAAGTSGGIVAAVTAAVTPAPDGVVLDRMIAYEGDPEDLPDPATATARARELAGCGFDLLLAEHRAAWAARWEDADVEIDGDDELQLGVRFALFHLMASVADEGEAAVGARGLSGQAYRGHVFWDSDTFVLPFLAATHPPAARAMLEYRVRRLDAALDTARRRGRRGARFPWESARTGYDVTPSSARDRTGRLVPIRTGLLEEHVVAQVAWATSCYVDWTGDADFARGPGLELLVQTARYWESRVRTDAAGAAHIYGVVGPDEYHEPVDDNAFTNVVARWNLRRAADAVEAADVGAPAGLDEARAWRHVADALVDGYDPTTRVYEQFAGFHELEALFIAEVAPRLPIAADLLLGRDRVRGAQVLKQADVLMLHHLVPEEVVPGSLRPNLDFYEPRTAHGSSLSPAMHAALAARAGDHEGALSALRMATRIDLDDLTGTTAGGLHLATMGGVWQALAFGFAGLRPRHGRLVVDPQLPPAWDGLRLRVRFHGSRVRVRIGHEELHLESDRPVPVHVDGIDAVVEGTGLRFGRAAEGWELLT